MLDKYVTDLTRSLRNYTDRGDSAVEVEVEEELYGVNLLPNNAPATKTQGGITFTKNADDSFTTSAGTPSENVNIYHLTEGIVLPKGTYIFSGLPSNLSNDRAFLEVKTGGWSAGTQVAVLNINNRIVTFTLNNDEYIYVRPYIYSGTEQPQMTWYPMIYKAELGSNLPYHQYNEQAIQNQLNAQGVLGAKNMLNVTAVSTSDVNGIDYTVNRDAKGNLVSVVANGTAGTGNSSFKLRANDIGANIPFPKMQTLRLTGCPTGGNATTGYYLKLRFGNQTTNNFTAQAIDTGGGANIYYPGYSSDANYGQTQYEIIIIAGCTVNNIVFKPQIALASDPDDTYVPYAMTNKELTENVFEKGVLTSSDDLNDVLETGLYKIQSGIPTHSPDNISWCSLLVNRINDMNVQQQIFQSNKIYQRAYSGNPASWGSWYKYTGTVVS